jgi:hypothetical protein
VEFSIGASKGSAGVDVAACTPSGNNEVKKVEEPFVGDFTKG